MTHRIFHTTKYGAAQVYRLAGAPDRDSAAAFVLAKFGGEVRSVDALCEDAGRIWGETDIGQWEAR